MQCLRVYYVNHVHVQNPVWYALKLLKGQAESPCHPFFKIIFVLFSSFFRILNISVVYYVLNQLLQVTKCIKIHLNPHLESSYFW